MARIKSKQRGVERYQYVYKMEKESRAVAFNFIVTVMSEFTRYVHKKHPWFVFEPGINKNKNQRRDCVSWCKRVFLYAYRLKPQIRATDLCTNFGVKAPLQLGETAYTKAWLEVERVKRPYLRLVKFNQ